MDRRESTLDQFVDAELRYAHDLGKLHHGDSRLPATD
jgi:hypothetical protein